MIERTVKSWESLVCAVDEIERDIRERADEHGIPSDACHTRNDRRFWYRGVSKVVHTLSPSLYRYRNGKAKETALFKRFSQIQLAIPAPRDNSWEQLVAMQHYQVPTRLLDWTEVVGVAAYFAAAPKSSDSPCIYILDAVWLNAQSGTSGIQELPTHFPLDYENHYLGDRLPPQYEHPFAAVTAFHNDRIQRQRGCFTIHGLNDRPLEIQFPECLGRVILTADARDDVCRHLERTNLNAFTLFPDFEGLAQFVATDVELEMPSYDQCIAGLIRASLREHHDRAKRSIQFGEYVPRNTDKDKLLDWLDPSNTQTFAIITGPAGIGKTTFLQKNFVIDPPKPVVFFSHKMFDVAAKRRFEDVIVAHVEKVVRDQLRERTRDATRPETIHHVAKEMIRSGDLLLVVDGLDEVARTSDLDTAKKLVQDLVDFLGTRSNAKVAVSCRDHILERLQIGEMLDRRSHREGGHCSSKDQFADVTLGALDKSELSDRISTFNDIPEKLRDFLRIPIFYKFIVGENALDSVEHVTQKAGLYEVWFKLVLKRAAGNSSGNVVDAAMEQLGKTAVETLKGRVDYFDPRRLHAELHELLRGEHAKHLRILDRESEDRCFFAHQSLREFVLASAVAKEIQGTSAFQPLSETFSFDYVGAETYEFVNDLLDFPKDVLLQLPSLVIPRSDDDAWHWNSRARNLFEMIGMLGEPQHQALNSIKDLSLSLLKTKRYKKMHVSFRVKQNIVRCLERLHPSAPTPYFDSVLHPDRYPKEAPGIKAYVIRGFQLPSPRPGRCSMIFKNRDRRTRNFKSMERDVVNALLDCAKELIDQNMETSVNFFRMNVSFALIRWLPRQKFDWDRLESAFPLDDGDVYVATNVYQCLKERNALSKVSPEYRALAERHRREL